jgi:hypothetical protein
MFPVLVPESRELVVLSLDISSYISHCSQFGGEGNVKPLAGFLFLLFPTFLKDDVELGLLHLHLAGKTSRRDIGREYEF